MHPLLCCTVAEPTMSDLRRVRDQCAAHADIVELRLDAVKAPIDVAGALAGRAVPAIVTCRPRRQGGQFDGSEEERLRLLVEAQRCGAEYVDVEWDAGFDQLLSWRGGGGVVLSMHDFETIPADLAERVKAMVSMGPEVVKIAVMTTRLADCIALAGVAHSYRDCRLAVVGMGAPGVVTRLLPARFGSCWSYAGHYAPGQIDAEQMLGGFRFRHVRAATRVYGVFGRPVHGSLSPAMHNAWFEHDGADAVYVPLDTDSAADALRFAEWLPLSGASVTSPLKVAMAASVASCSRVARRVGAVNTLVREGGRWSATNTDVEGFLAPLRARRLSLGGTRAAIVGAGGAARAAAIALAEGGAAVTVHARRAEAAAQVAALVGAKCDRHMPAPGSWDLLVNATPVHWDAASLGLVAPAVRGATVYDLISNPPQTPLLDQARAAGCATVSGLEMLVAQAEVQALSWTGRRPPSGLMRAAAIERAKGRPCG